MAVIYVREQGAYVRKVDKRIVIEKNCAKLAEIPVREITNLSVLGNVQISTQALQLLIWEGIDVSYFTYSGKYIGQVVSGTSKNVFLRMAQYEMYRDNANRLQIARRIVENKIRNQIAVIKGFNWNGIDYDYSKEVKILSSQIEALQFKCTSNQIMGVEGNCSAIYFGVFGYMFKCRLKFDKRSRRPPKDPINIILSLAYTLLTKEVICSLESESFETYMGFLHGIKYGRQSLALDIVEEFRQPVVDRLVLYIFNKQILSELDFEKRDERIELTESAFKKFCKEYEKWMNKPVSSRDGRNFRTIIHNQVSILKRAIKENTEYIPFGWENKDVFD